MVNDKNAVICKDCGHIPDMHDGLRCHGKMQGREIPAIPRRPGRPAVLKSYEWFPCACMKFMPGKNFAPKVGMTLRIQLGQHKGVRGELIQIFRGKHYMIKDTASGELVSATLVQITPRTPSNRGKS